MMGTANCCDIRPLHAEKSELARTRGCPPTDGAPRCACRSPGGREERATRLVGASANPVGWPARARGRKSPPSGPVRGLLHEVSR